MNISTLSQQLNMSVQELRARIAELGIRVSPRQRKIDNVVARTVLDKLKPVVATATVTLEDSSKKISLTPTVVVKDLAAQMKVSVVDVIKGLIKNGVMAAMNEQIDFDTASIVAADFGFEVQMAELSAPLSIGTGYVAEVLAS